ncbi:hypothetical protein KJ909_02660 [Patescibacteria group bacterium]|nr:hypothetical protein [Patescibacteria group bacterium]
MVKRKKVLLIFGMFYGVFVLLMCFGLKSRMANNFSEIKLKEMISGKSKFRDMTDDLCKYQILGDPKEVGNYVKINIMCVAGRKASSTLSLSATEDKTVEGVIKEYARIIGFEEKLLAEKNFKCYLDNKILTAEMEVQMIRPTSTIDCYEKVNDEE